MDYISLLACIHIIFILEMCSNSFDFVQLPGTLIVIVIAFDIIFEYNVLFLEMNGQ